MKLGRIHRNEVGIVNELRASVECPKLADWRLSSRFTHGLAECEHRYSNAEHHKTGKNEKRADTMSVTPSRSACLSIAQGLPAGKMPARNNRVFIGMDLLLGEIDPIPIIVVASDPASFFLCSDHARQAIACAVMKCICLAATTIAAKSSVLAPEMRSFSTAAANGHCIGGNPEGGQQ
ncbi:hypothetical protein P3T24_006320 [Paraburkholderia sp. GAS33]